MAFLDQLQCMSVPLSGHCATVCQLQSCRTRNKAGGGGKGGGQKGVVVGEHNQL